MLPKAYRLKEKRDFDSVYRRGEATACAAFVLYRRKRRPGSQTRAGFSVSKKVGKAVVRNRIRRRFRHALRELLPELPTGRDYVFVVRRAALQYDHNALLAAMRRSLGCQLQQKKEEARLR